MFALRTPIPLLAYDAQLGGFPIFRQPFDRTIFMTYNNRDVRVTVLKAPATLGMQVIAQDYGFLSAEVWFLKDGWVVPATPD